MNRAELLAPAGDGDAAWAAFHYGADAVYLGLHQFSARAMPRSRDAPSSSPSIRSS
jgi:putative protease